MLHFKFLRAQGFEVAEVVAVGEKLRFGIPVEGFLLTREVPGQDLFTVYKAAGIDDRQSIMERFGSLVGKLHNQGFFGSIRLKDIICSGKPGESMKMTLIDREVRNPYPRSPTRAMILQRLLLNARRQIRQGETLSLQDWKIFTRFYCLSLPESLKIRRKTIRQEIGQILERTTTSQSG